MMRVDHFEFPRREAVEQVKRLPLAITVQPGFSWLDKRYLKSYEQYLPPEKIAQQAPLRELYEAGGMPVRLQRFAGTVHRPLCPDAGHDGILPARPGADPLPGAAHHTVNPAQMLGEETEWGTLEEGKRADFMVLKKTFWPRKAQKQGRSARNTR